jgi:hypothetical protein
MCSTSSPDAKSVQRFVLDTASYPENPVLVDGLSEFQGPALLAYNDAIFTEKDFASLTSLGDSKKLQDKAATGKFGLGFSSVCFSFHRSLALSFPLTGNRPSIGQTAHRLCLDPLCSSLTPITLGHGFLIRQVARITISPPNLETSP